MLTRDLKVKPEVRVSSFENIFESSRESLVGDTELIGSIGSRQPFSRRWVRPQAMNGGAWRLNLLVVGMK